MAQRPEDPARAHANECHERWRKQLNRRQGEPYYLDEWHGRQCLMCRHFIPLEGPLGEDWGACTNANSPFDRYVMFEHDGCNQFEERPDADND